MKTFKTLSVSLLLGLAAITNAQEQSQQPTPVSQAEKQPTTTIRQNLNAVNINTASVAELQDKLVGIGEKKAQAIVDYRTQNGSFKSIEQLAEVSGIGQATVEKNKANIVLE